MLDTYLPGLNTPNQARTAIAIIAAKIAQP
jgi:hypothetical protein